MPGESPCGRTNMRIRGWMGRADQTAKIKGMFVRPEQVAALAPSGLVLVITLGTGIGEQDMDDMSAVLEALAIVFNCHEDPFIAHLVDCDTLFDAIFISRHNSRHE